MFKRFFAWGRALVSHGLEWIEQQVLRQTKPSVGALVVGIAVDAVRSREDLILENALLRQQVVILKRSVKRVQPTNTDRRILVWLTSRLKGWRDALLVVKPATILVWHRTLFRLYWRQKSRATVGRPSLAHATIELVKQMAADNRLWGAERIQGELLKLGIKLSKRTIQKYMRQARSRRPSGQTWTTFLHNHAHQIWACDFLPIVDLFFRQCYAFFIVELGSRRVVHLGVTATPTDAWVAQQLREATPFGEGPKYLIRDNDSKYGSQFAGVAAGATIKILKTPVGAPNANAVCERFLGSVRRECLDHLLLIGPRSISRVLKEYVDYFNHLRPHQGLGQRIPEPSSFPASGQKPLRILRRPVLGGLHHSYRRAA
jgi:putative transposase